MFATVPQSEKLHCVPKCITSGFFFSLSLQSFSIFVDKVTWMSPFFQRKCVRSQAAAAYLCGSCVKTRWSVVPTETPCRRSAAASFCTASAALAPAFWTQNREENVISGRPRPHLTFTPAHTHTHTPVMEDQVGHG